MDESTTVLLSVFICNYVSAVAVVTPAETQQVTCCRHTNHCWTLSPGCPRLRENPPGFWSSGTGQPERGSERKDTNTPSTQTDNQDLREYYLKTFWGINWDMADRRQVKVMREKEKTIRTMVETKKKNQCSIFLLYWVSFSLHGPSPQGKVGRSGMQWEGVEWEGARNDSHPEI